MVDAGELTQRIRQAFAAIYHQRARLVTIESALGRDALVVERLSGREAVSECFQLEVDCVAPSAQFELKTLIGEPLTLRLMQASGDTRVWHGYATRASMLGSDGGMARYRVVLSPWLTLLSQRRNVLIFQNKTALEIIESIFSDYPQANYATDVSQSLATRSRCTQYRETDLEFVERLLAEEGLCYRFVHDADQSAADDDENATHGPTLYIYDRKADAPDVAPADIRFHRVSQVEAEDGITAFRKQARLTPNATTLSAWDAMKLRAHAHQAQSEDSLNLPPLELYNGTRASLRHRDPAGVEQSADLRLAAARLQANTASGASSARQLAAGSAFTLTEHASENGRYVVWAVEHRAANNLGAHLAHLMGQPDIESGSYRNHFVCAPDSVDVVPVNTGKPAAPGPETALVVGVADQALTSTRDHSVKVQFPWQRGDAPNRGGLTETHSSENPDGNAPGDERNGTWVRVSESLAGPNWGASFVPRIGTEVLIDYLEGDIDQPMIVGQFYNGTDAPPFAAGADSSANHPGTIAGTHTHALDNSGHNQWLHDDAPGQLRQRMATSQAGSELNLGYLIHQNSATRGAYRGQGAELKTGGWAALRAPQGLLLSTTARQRGVSTPHDVAEAVGQLKAAHDLAGRLSDTASAQQADGLKANSAQADFTQTLDPEQDGVYESSVGGQDHHKTNPGSRDAGDAAERFATPSVLFDSPSTIATLTPASSLLYAGQNTHMTVQGEVQHTASGTYSHVSGATTSLYTHDGGLQGVAANGTLSLQAHDDTLEILADDSITTTSSQTRIDMLASSKIVLIAGQSTVTLDGSNITFACPGTFTVKGGTHDFVGPGSQTASLNPLPRGSADGAVNAFKSSNFAFTTQDWTTKDVVRALCEIDPAMVNELRDSRRVAVADKIVYHNQYYDGAKWTTRSQEVQASSDSSKNSMVFSRRQDLNLVLVSLRHELVHETQPASMTRLEKETQAFTKTESWAIEHNLPGGDNGTSLRKKTADGRTVPDVEKIRKGILDKYAISENSSNGPELTGLTKDGQVVFSDGSTRAPRKGDKLEGDPEIIGEKVLNSSDWQCPIKN